MMVANFCISNPVFFQ